LRVSARACLHLQQGEQAMIRFPLRRIPAVLIVRARGGGWLALVGSNGWLFATLREARHEARGLACSLNLPVRELLL
jgi:hypothetical protein